MRVTLIHNPDAGGGKQPRRKKLVRLIRAAGHEVVYQSSKDDDWAMALEQPCELVAIAGGDGTVGTVAGRMIGRGISLAVLPTGSANNIAKALGVADFSFERQISGWEDARRMQFDAGVAQGPWGSKYFIEGLGIGLFASTMHRAKQRQILAPANDPKAKIARTIQTLKRKLRSFPARQLKARLDGRELSGDYVLLEVMNIQNVGPNLYLAPGADPGDGRLDVSRPNPAGCRKRTNLSMAKSD